mgnify:CR=1 FL=1
MGLQRYSPMRKFTLRGVNHRHFSFPEGPDGIAGHMPDKQFIPNYVAFSKSTSLRGLIIAIACTLFSGCINPLGPVGKGPQLASSEILPAALAKIRVGHLDRQLSIRRPRRRARGQRLFLF